MILETERLVLREWRESDADDYIALQGDPKVRRFFPAPLTAKQAHADLLEHMEKRAAHGFHYMAAELKPDGTFVGLIGIGKAPEIIREVVPSRPHVEIGWVIHHRFWGQGLAPEGAARCRDYAFSQLGLPEIVAFTAAINLPSRRVMEKIGMKYDPADDYLHPKIAHAHPLRPHVVYRVANPAPDMP